MAHRTVMILSLFFVFALSISALPLLELRDAGPDSTSIDSPTTRSLPIDRWPGFRGDDAKTGNTSATGPSSYNLLWNKASVASYNSPVVMYDQIYVASGQNLRCYDLAGTLVWTFNIGTWSYNSPLVYNGRVYMATGSAKLYCLDANATGTGTTTNYWTYTPSMATASEGSACTDGQRIFYSAQHATEGLIAVWLSNGSKAWTFPLGGSTSTEASPAYWNGRVYCGAGDSYAMSTVTNMYCVNATSGMQIWAFSASDDICSTPAIDYGRVYFGSSNGRVYCVDAIGSGSTTTKYWEYNAGAMICGSPAVAYGCVYIGDEHTTGTNLRCLDAFGSGGTTTQYWGQLLTPVGTFGICGSPAVTSSYVFVGTGGNAIHCRDRSNGALVWSNTYTGGGYGICSSPAVFKDRVVVCSDSGTMYVIGPTIDLIPPKVLSTNPSNSATNVPAENNISIRFSEVVYRSNLSTTTLTLKNSLNQPVAGVVSADLSIQTAYFTPNADLKRGETFTFTASTEITDWSYNHLDGNGNGLFDGPLTDQYQFSFTTVPPKPPVIGSIPTLHPTEDVPYMLNLSSIISDPDTPIDQLVLTENSTHANLSGYELHLLYPNGITSDLINISVSDDLFTVYRNVPVIVSSVNDPSKIDPIPTLYLNEDVSFELDLTDYITDNDTAFAEMSITDNSTYTKISGLALNFTYPNGVTYDKDNVTLSDKGLKIYAMIEVRITPMNDAPTIAAIPPLNVVEDEVTNKSLNGYINDIDTPEEELVIICESPYVTVYGHFLELLYTEGIFNDTLTVTVSDGGANASTTMEVVMEPVNDAPFWNGVPNITASEDVYGEFDLTPYINDTDTPFKDLTLISDSKYGRITGKKFQFTYTEGVYVEYVTFTLQDDEYSAKMKVNVTVTPLNDKPALSKPLVSPTKGNTTTKFTFTVLYSDVDTSKDPNVKVVIDGIEYACAKSSGNLKTGAIFKYETNLSAGNHTFSFMANDMDGGNATTLDQTVSVKKEVVDINTDDDDTGTGGMSGMAIGIIVLIAIVVLMAIIAVVVLMLMKKKKKAPAQEPAQAPQQPAQPPVVQASSMYPASTAGQPASMYQPAPAQQVPQPQAQPGVTGLAQSQQLGIAQQNALPPYNPQQPGQGYQQQSGYGNYQQPPQAQTGQGQQQQNW